MVSGPGPPFDCDVASALRSATQRWIKAVTSKRKCIRKRRGLGRRWAEAVLKYQQQGGTQFPLGHHGAAGWLSVREEAGKGLLPQYSVGQFTIHPSLRNPRVRSFFNLFIFFLFFLLKYKAQWHKNLKKKILPQPHLSDRKKGSHFVHIFPYVQPPAPSLSFFLSLARAWHRPPLWGRH